jgi:oxygen-independent coproporphyrinogen-3 oxidase
LGFSLYIHLPYCVRKCAYCDFNTYAQPSFPEGEYAAALLREIGFAATRPAWQGRKVSTLFFGGGTPSLFSPETIASLVESVERLFGFAASPEISLEANPGTLEGGGVEKLRAFRRAGVNRLSFGVQSFDQRHLQSLGRIHDAADADAAVTAAREAGFDNLSCDLIFAVPGQTLRDWERDLRRLIAHAPEHVATYSLTYEPGTALTARMRAGKVAVADEEDERAMYETAIQTLADAGYRHYEISNFARSAREARHNLAYWTWRDYLGIGAGAHGFSRLGSGCGPWGERYANRRLPADYMGADDGAWVDSRELIGRSAAMSEFVMLGLRLIDGFAMSAFQATFDCDFGSAFADYRGLRDGGFLEHSGGNVKLTHEGLMLADSVISRLAASALAA